MPDGFVAKVVAAFLVVLLALSAAGIFSVRSLAEASERSQTVIGNDIDDVVHAERLRTTEDRQAAAGRGYLITRGPEFLARLEEAEIAFDRALTDLRSRVYTDAGTKLLGSVSRAAERYKEAQRRVLTDESSSADASTVRGLFETEVVPRRRSLSQAIEAFVDYKETRLRDGFDHSRALISRAVVVSSIGILLALVASAVFAWAMSWHLAVAYRREAGAHRSAARALAARDELLGIVAHDLRTPLGAIVLHASLLERRLDKDDRGRAKAISTVAKRMDHLIRTLLDAASVEAGRFSIDRAPCDVAEMLREAVDTARDSAAAKSMRIEIHVGGRDLSIFADRDRFIQVVTNLLTNAIKFGFEGGRVTLVAEGLVGEVRFSISDDGPGIAAEHLPRVFDRFWKAGPGKQGTGLGLYIAKTIVEAHGGRISVDSQQGHGAKFQFTVPTSQQARSPSGASTEDSRVSSLEARRSSIRSKLGGPSGSAST